MNVDKLKVHEFLSGEDPARTVFALGPVQFSIRSDFAAEYRPQLQMQCRRAVQNALDADESATFKCAGGRILSRDELLKEVVAQPH